MDGRWWWKRHHLKPIDKDRYRRASKYPGRNKRERTSSLVKAKHHKEGGQFSFLGFDFRLNKNREGKTYVSKTPRAKKRIEIGRRVKTVLKVNWNKPMKEVICSVNEVVRGWVNYFRIGNSSSTFNKVRDDIEKKVRKFVMKRKKRKGLGWKRWSKEDIYRKTRRALIPVNWNLWLSLREKKT